MFLTCTVVCVALACAAAVLASRAWAARARDRTARDRAAAVGAHLSARERLRGSPQALSLRDALDGFASDLDDGRLAETVVIALGSGVTDDAGGADGGCDASGASDAELADFRAAVDALVRSAALEIMCAHGADGAHLALVHARTVLADGGRRTPAQVLHATRVAKRGRAIASPAPPVPRRSLAATW